MHPPKNLARVVLTGTIAPGTGIVVACFAGEQSAGVIALRLAGQAAAVAAADLV